MATIGAFILARVDDDAFLADHMVRRGTSTAPPDEAGLALLRAWDPWRVLAACAVRRTLVLNHRVGGEDPTATCPCGRPDAVEAPCYTLRALALEWADHGDYQAAWRAHPVPRQARSA